MRRGGGKSSGTSRRGTSGGKRPGLGPAMDLNAARRQAAPARPGLWVVRCTARVGLCPPSASGPAAGAACSASSSAATADTILFIWVPLSGNRFAGVGWRLKVGTAPPGRPSTLARRKQSAKGIRGWSAQDRFFLASPAGAGQGLARRIHTLQQRSFFLGVLFHFDALSSQRPSRSRPARSGAPLRAPSGRLSGASRAAQRWPHGRAGRPFVPRAAGPGSANRLPRSSGRWRSPGHGPPPARKP
jgi:hypothetical protein